MTTRYGATTDPQERPGGFAEGRKVVGVRVGGHPAERFDRVVLDLSAGGDPGFWVGYTDGAHRQGSGEPVEVPGAAVLTVVVHGTDWTADQPPEYGGAPVDGPGGSIVGVRWDGTFEGDTQVFVGTAERLPFRVAVLGSPTRVYVDVVHPWPG